MNTKLNKRAFFIFLLIYLIIGINTAIFFNGGIDNFVRDIGSLTSLETNLLGFLFWPVFFPIIGLGFFGLVGLLIFSVIGFLLILGLYKVSILIDKRIFRRNE